MSHKKERLLKFLEKRNYPHLPENIFPPKNVGKKFSDAGSLKTSKKNKVEAIRRYQKFSGLRTTGRVNKLTLDQTKKPSCSFPDVTTKELLTASFSPPRWNTTKITYGFRNFTIQLTQPEIKEAIREAFAIWNSAFPAFQFLEVEFDDDPMILFRFVKGNHQDGFPFTGGDGDLAHAFPPNHHLIPGQVHFDDEEEWSIDFPASGKDLVTVAIHEIGHALGLGHSDSQDSIMFAIYSEPHRFLIHEDIDNITDLYDEIS